jgi:ligand-binding sensor domain-containing protein
VESAGLPYPTVLGLAVDPRGVAWVGTGAGAAMVDVDALAARRGGSRAFTGVNAPLMHQVLDAVYVDRLGQVWFGSAGGVNVYRPDAGGGPGTWPTGFNRLSTRGGLPHNQVYTIFGDSRGRIWFGTGAGVAALTVSGDEFGLGAYDAGRWTTYTRPAAPLAGDTVHAIAEDRRGRLYFGTASGISVLDESEPDPTRRWRRLGAGPAGGLPDPAVQALAVAPDGRLWAGTRDGLAVLDPERPDAGWQTFRALPLSRWLAVWPARRESHILADDVTALVFTR